MIPPFSEEAWIQFGAAGVLALFVLLMTSMFLWYIAGERKDRVARDERWQTFLNNAHEQFIRAIATEQAQRMQSVSGILNGQSRLLDSAGKVADAIGRHDLEAVERQQKLLQAILDNRSVMRELGHQAGTKPPG